MKIKRQILRWIPAVAVLAACSDLPTDVPATTRPVLDRSTAEVTVAAGVDDALARLLPALRNQAAATSLQGALRELKTALANGGVEATRQATTAATRALETYANGSDPAEAPDLDALRLAVATH
jgi:hypothetical protein